MLISIFLQGLPGHSLQSVFWLSPTHSQNFRETVAKNLIRRPQPSAGAHQTKSKDQGRWWLALAKPRFWKFGCCTWVLFLETSETDTSVNPKSKFSKLFKEQWHDHIRAKNYIVLHCTMHLQCTMVIKNIQLARNFREKNLSRGELNFRED